jgi:hypothetical protein
LQGREAFNLSEQDLQKYIGVYVFDDVSAIATLSVKDNSLWASVPGDGDFELVPVSPNTFRLKSLEGYKVVFEMNGDKPAGLHLINQTEHIRLLTRKINFLGT